MRVSFSHVSGICVLPNDGIKIIGVDHVVYNKCINSVEIYSVWGKQKIITTVKLALSESETTLFW